MRRSDLPHVSRLDETTQRVAVDEMWRAYAKAEKNVVPDDFRRQMACPVSYVATMEEMLEAALSVVQELDFPGQFDALRERACQRFHPGEPCKRGDNHPEVAS